MNPYERHVDMLTQQIIQCNYTPTELCEAIILREAAMLAAIRHEMRYPRPSYMLESGSLRRVDSYHGRNNPFGPDVPDLTENF